MENIVLISSFFAGVYAGSCYYEHTNPTYYISSYEYCLAGCCGAYKLGGLKHCCNSTGATIGILIAVVVFVALVITACIAYRRRRRRLLLVNAVVDAGSCYYKENMYNPVFPNYHPDDFTVYEFCLNGCCGSTKIGGIKHCCDEKGVIIGTFVGMVVFFVLIAASCAICRRESRRDLRINGGLSERGRLIPPPTQYPSTAGHGHYQSQARFNYQ
ncbi:unnamed protein product [Mytilus coruscus]|uniref:Uncharacterized protein n=1 Tax=Mytilus coruscus TaxID=42192 RepID=A0A6J8BHN9_MYTCO|nr:unnamed protein product [Mytilus coruscus]